MVARAPPAAILSGLIPLAATSVAAFYGFLRKMTHPLFHGAPKGLEFRFLGPRLILLDTEADLIVDFTERMFTP